MSFLSSYRYRYLIIGLLLIPLSVSAQVVQEVPERASQGRHVHESARGFWTLSADTSQPGLNCAVTFVSARNKGTSFGFFGPTPSVPAGILVYARPAIPAAVKPTEIHVAMLFEGEAPVTVRAIHAPSRNGVGHVFIPTKDIRAAIEPINDVEKNMGLRIGKASVFMIDYDGGKAARSALLGCLAGR